MRWFPEPTVSLLMSMARLDPFRRAGLAPWAGPGLLLGWDSGCYLEIRGNSKGQQRWYMKSCEGEQGVHWDGEIWHGIPATGLTVLGGETRARMGRAALVVRAVASPITATLQWVGSTVKPWKVWSGGKEVCIDSACARAQFTDASSDRFCTYPVTSKQRSWTKWLCVFLTESQPEKRGLRMEDL